MEPISRRRALTLGGLGVASTVIGGTGLLRTITARFEPAADAALVEPPMLASTGGRLQLRLEATEGPVTLAGRQATALRYNGGLPGPTLHLQPGDRLQVQLVNRLSAPTNLHMHGLHVSPEGNGDNVFVTIEPGESFDYAYRLPEDHPPGVYWYHPHHHGMVADQISGGLYGAIIVGDPDPAPDNGLAPLSVTRGRTLVVSDISLDGTGRLEPPSAMERMMGREGDLVLVNGQVRPQLDARPGQRERWRIVNACAARYLRLRLDGQHMRLLGIDSGRFRHPRDLQEVVLVPGNRADLLVTTDRGTSQLRALPYDRGAMMGMMGTGGSDSSGKGGGMPGTGVSAGDQPATGYSDGTVLATVKVAGRDGTVLPAVPAQPEPRDLRTAAVAARRKLTFAMGMGMGGGGMLFTIDGKKFDPDRVDQTVQVGTVEEWTLTNASPMDHPVHLHVWPMQLIARGGRPLEPPIWQDVVNVPARSDVTVRVAFDTFTGRTVYHCHILDHEDNGMMGVIDAT